MNQVILMGRLVRDPDVRWTQGPEQKCIARYTLAVDRRGAKEGQQQADFISCVTFGKGGEFAEKYLKKGIKIAITGRLTTGSYTNREGQKVYTTDIIVDSHEFAESKAADSGSQNQKPSEVGEGFMDIPMDVDDEGLPFN